MHANVYVRYQVLHAPASAFRQLLLLSSLFAQFFDTRGVVGSPGLSSAGVDAIFKVEVVPVGLD